MLSIFAVVPKKNCFLAKRQQAVQQQQRLFASVYTLGQGWTGALGNSRFDQDIVGHNDEENPDVPHFLYTSDRNIVSASAGWGHTALVVQEDNNKNKVLLCGRPHDFQALLRLHRFPPVIRKWAVQFQTFDSDIPIIGNIIDHALGNNNSEQKNQKASSNTDNAEDEEQDDWDEARKFSILSHLEEVSTLPHDDSPQLVHSSAGWTAILGRSGRLYTFGLNNRGQCGMGKLSNNEWKPRLVTGLHPDFTPDAKGSKLNAKKSDNNNKQQQQQGQQQQQHPMKSMALGLQHGYALSVQGHVYAWGKGNRGQLGQETTVDQSVYAKQIQKCLPNNPTIMTGEEKNNDDQQQGKKEEEEESLLQQQHPFPPMTQISSGFYHGAALSETNEIYIWGKNMLRDDAKLQDAIVPTPILRSSSQNNSQSSSLPPVDQLRVEQISCGSHHTSILMEDGSVYAMGVTTDTKEMLLEPYLLVPPGLINMPVRQFTSDFDRTTIVGNCGTQVLQVHLWKDPTSREYAIFTPFWVDSLFQNAEAKPIRSIHRGWLHTVVVTD